MKHHEVKYRVGSLDAVKKKLTELKANKLSHQTTYHYYAKQHSSDVNKLVLYPDKAEVHILKEKNGTFTLTGRVTVKGKEEGLALLHNEGFENITLVKMESTEYQYGEGTIGLYTVNGTLLSIIVDFPSKSQASIAELLEISSCEIIQQPFNKYLEAEKQPHSTSSEEL